MLIIVRPSRSSPRKRATRPRRKRALVLGFSVVVSAMVLCCCEMIETRGKGENAAAGLLPASLLEQFVRAAGRSTTVQAEPKSTRKRGGKPTQMTRIQVLAIFGRHFFGR
jgi:hypothetical protein